MRATLVDDGLNSQLAQFDGFLVVIARYNVKYMTSILLGSHTLQRTLETLHSFGGLSHIKNSPLICRANQWTGFYVIGNSVIKELKVKIIVKQQQNMQNT